MIVDAHTHYGLCYQERDGLDPERWMQDLRAAGVGAAVVCGHRALLSHTTDIERANDELAEVVERTRGFAVAMGTVQPFAGSAALKEADRCLATLGMRGIKLHPWLQGFPSLFDPAVYRLCDLCAETDVPILLHDGTSHVSMPSQIGLLARKHPRTTFILGHGGLLHLWRSAADVAATCENVYATLCGPHPAALRHICRTVPTERILWGSDAGIAFINYTDYRRGLIDCLELNEHDYAAIIGANVRRLLNWEPA